MMDSIIKVEEKIVPGLPSLGKQIVSFGKAAMEQDENLRFVLTNLEFETEDELEE